MTQVHKLHPDMQQFLNNGGVKPVVHYRPDYYQFIPKEPGQRAMVYPVDHPNHLPVHCVSNEKMCFTSTVIRVGENGEFETLNTIYRPVATEK
jgi:hypothetical protein